MTFTHALKWSFLAELASKAIQPVIFIVLARLLTPEDFGVMSAALMVIGFSQIFWEAGMGKALVQRQTDIADAANAAFWINLGLGCVIAAILYLSAELIARTFFKDERVTLVLQVMTLQVVLGALAAVHTALLQKGMGFKSLFWVRFATVSLPGLASIPLALNGMGCWALVAGALAGQLVQVVMLWFMSDWRPRWVFNIRVAKEMGHFGAWVGVSGLLAWFYIWVDSLVIGMYLGSHDLGLYRTGNQISSMIFAFVFGPILPVFYSHFTAKRNPQESLSTAMEHVIRLLTLIAIPMAFALLVLSEPIESLLFGRSWDGIALVIGVMSLTHGYLWIVGMSGDAFRAIGAPHIETMVMLAAFSVFVPFYIVSIHYGFAVFLWTRMSLGLISLFLHLVVLRIYFIKSLVVSLRLIVLVTLLTVFVDKVTGLIFLDYSVFNLQCIFVRGLINLMGTYGILYFLQKDFLQLEVPRLFQQRADETYV